MTAPTLSNPASLGRDAVRGFEGRRQWLWWTWQHEWAQSFSRDAGTALEPGTRTSPVVR
jgi:hypothetical protein